MNSRVGKKPKRLASINKGNFKPGNQIGRLNKGKGPSRPDFLTQALISQLHEVDANTSKEKQHLLAERLLMHALGGVVKHRRRVNGREQVFYDLIPSTVHGIKEVYDRVQGKAIQGVDFNSTTGRITVTFDEEDADA